MKKRIISLIMAALLCTSLIVFCGGCEVAEKALTGGSSDDLSIESYVSEDMDTLAVAVTNNGDKLLKYAEIGITAYDKDGNVMDRSEKWGTGQDYRRIHLVKPGEAGALYETDYSAFYDERPAKIEFNIRRTEWTKTDSELLPSYEVLDSSTDGWNVYTTIRNDEDCSLHMYSADGHSYSFYFIVLFRDEQGNIIGARESSSLGIKKNSEETKTVELYGPETYYYDSADCIFCIGGFF